MKPLLTDIQGNEIFPGDHIVAQLKTWNGYIEIAAGPVQYIEPSLSCYGCGYAICDPVRGETFLNTLSTSVELVKVECQAEMEGQKVPEDSFTIRCNACGAEVVITEGERKRREITFGTDVMEVDFISCGCGNRLESEYRWMFRDDEDEGALIDRWCKV